MRITTFLRRSKAAVAATVLLAAGAGAVAQAATPESGTVSPDEPRVTWEGTVESSGVHHLLWEEELPSPPCEQPICDTFALTVDGDDRQELTIGLNLQDVSLAEEEADGGIRVTKPDGSVAFVSGTSGPKTTLRYRLRRAPPGEYSVTVSASFICCGEAPYKAFAEVPPRPGTAPQAPADQGPPPPELTVSAPKRVSARTFRQRRRLPVTLESTGAVRDVRAVLTRRRTRIASARLASLEGRKRVALKASRRSARRIRKGIYFLSVSGVDSQGRAVGSAIRLRIRR